MKKILYALLIATMFVACSDNQDETNLPDDTKTYSISFNVNSLTKEVDPILKSRSGKVKNRFLHFMFKRTEPLANGFGYEESKRITYIPENVAIEDYPVDIKLPVGTYEVSVLFGKDHLDYIGQGLTGPKLSSYNLYNGYPTVFNTGEDAEINRILDVDNSDVHMNKPSTFTVSSTGSNVVDIELLPMWSNVNLTIEDASTATVPEGTKYVALTLYKKGAQGISIREEGVARSYPLNRKTKVAAGENRFEDFLTHHTVLSLVDFRSLGVIKTDASGGVTCPGHTINYELVDCGDQTCKDGGKRANLETVIGIAFLSENNQESYAAPLESHVIYKHKIENGFNYNIKGKLDNINPEGGNKFSITLNELTNVDKPLEVQ